MDSHVRSSRCRRKVCEGNYAYSDEEGLTDFSTGSGDDYEPEHDSESLNTGKKKYFVLYRNSNILIG
jgi:hypothetical protein